MMGCEVGDNVPLYGGGCSDKPQLARDFTANAVDNSINLTRPRDETPAYWRPIIAGKSQLKEYFS